MTANTETVSTKQRKSTQTVDYHRDATLFSQGLRRMRRRAGLTQAAVAARLRQLVGRYVGHGKRQFCGTVRWTEAEASRQAAKRTGPDRDRQQPAKPTGDPKASRPAPGENVVSPPLHQESATLEKIGPRIRRHRLIGLDVGESGLADLERSLGFHRPHTERGTKAVHHHRPLLLIDKLELAQESGNRRGSNAAERTIPPANRKDVPTGGSERTGSPKSLQRLRRQRHTVLAASLHAIGRQDPHGVVVDDLRPDDLGRLGETSSSQYREDDEQLHRLISSRTVRWWLSRVSSRFTSRVRGLVRAFRTGTCGCVGRAAVNSEPFPLWTLDESRPAPQTLTSRRRSRLASK